jgi:NAD(P)-dependent dehydrogenase (short-subunit alcohol dehydrogenase family)
MANTKWTVDNIPDQHDKRVVITGANSGIGYEAALALARKGAQVILAVRSLKKGAQAVAQIQQAVAQARVEVLPLDLADLSSVRRFADAFLQRHEPLAILINNAGVMAIPFRRTVDGFEMQFGRATTVRLAPHRQCISVHQSRGRAKCGDGRAANPVCRNLA